MKMHWSLWTGLLLALGAPQAFAAPLKINGSTTVNLPVAEAAEILRAEAKMAIQVDTQGGSSGGISLLGDGLVQVGMASKPLSDSDRAKYPAVNFVETTIGVDAVAMVVSKDVWENGVRRLSRQQLQDIYEGKITNWKDVGGSKSQRIAFFNKEPGRGTWEVFAHWVYGNPKLAPQVSYPEVGGNEEARNKVAGTRGGMSQLSASWADGTRVYALALQMDDGTDILPTTANIANRCYPMSRPLNLLTNGAPTGEAKVLVDFLLGPTGQALMPKHGYLKLADLAPASAHAPAPTATPAPAAAAP
jgi:phosphate transport system substrate-binding protein